MKGGVWLEIPVMGMILIYSGISDLREYKIKNPAVVFGWCAGIILQAYHGGLTGLMHCISCILGTIIICMPLYCVGGVGAGDIKLISVVSGLHGALFAWKTAVVFVILSGICSLCKLLKMNVLRERIAGMYFLFRYSPRAAVCYYLDKKGKEEFVIPLAPVLAAAYFGVCLLQSFWG